MTETSQAVAERLRPLLEAEAGSVVVVHAPAGFGKSTVLRATSDASLYHQLTADDRQPWVLACALTRELGRGLSERWQGSPVCELAAATAEHLRGATVSVTLDGEYQLAEYRETARFVNELVRLAGVGFRLGTRIRPAIELERLRLEGRLRVVGPEELRWRRHEVASYLQARWGREPSACELDVADEVLGGWPAAIALWQQEAASDLWAPLRSNHPLHEFLHEILASTLPQACLQALQDRVDALLRPGPLRPPPDDPAAQVVDHLVRARLGVVRAGKEVYLHPLMAEFLRIHRPYWTALPSRWDTVGPPQRLPPPAPAGARLKVRALGGLRVWVEGRELGPADWRSEPALRLFKLLLSVPCQGVTAEQAARALWPRHTRRSSLNSFYRAVHDLRRTLDPQPAPAGASLVTREGREYRLRAEEIQCDAFELARLLGPSGGEAGEEVLEAAVELYAGEFLAGEEGEPFVVRRRRELRASVLGALDLLADRYLASSRFREALRALDRLVGIDPVRDDAWLRMAQAELALGNPQRALRALRRCEESLAAGGRALSPAISRLREQVLSQLTLQDLPGGGGPGGRRPHRAPRGGDGSAPARSAG